MNTQLFKYPRLLWVALMIFLVLPYDAVLARKKKNDPRFDTRKKEGVAQLKHLIRQNKENTRKDLAHKNWYIFGDPVRLIGEKVLLNPKYGRFTPKQIQEANKKLRDFNKAQAGKVVFYVYLTGFKVPLASELKSIEAKDYPEFKNKNWISSK